MSTHRSRTGATQTPPRRRSPAKRSRNPKSAKTAMTATGAKSGAKDRAKEKASGNAAPGKASTVPLRAQVRRSADPRVLEAAYRAFERLTRPRYLH